MVFISFLFFGVVAGVVAIERNDGKTKDRKEKSGVDVKEVVDVPNVPIVVVTQMVEIVRTNIITQEVEKVKKTVKTEPLKSMPQIKSTPESREVSGWVDARQGTKIGDDIYLSIFSIEIQRIELVSMFEEREISRNKLLAINIDIKNMSSTKKYDYTTWRGRKFLLENDYGVLVDTFGNGYKRMKFGTSKIAEGIDDTQSVSLYPGTTLHDILVFEVPIANVEALFLKLPLKNIGTFGVVVFKIPINLISGR